MSVTFWVFLAQTSMHMLLQATKRRGLRGLASRAALGFVLNQQLLIRPHSGLNASVHQYMMILHIDSLEYKQRQEQLSEETHGRCLHCLHKRERQ